MIRITCPGCQSKLSAKENLAGQTRKCPKCGTPVLISGRDESDAPPKGVVLTAAGQTTLLSLDLPEHLDRSNRYLICDHAKLVACWQADGKGWMLKTIAGLVSARRNPELLPSRGDFKLVELEFAATDAGPRLEGLTSYQLASSWALTTLEKGDDQILTRVVGPGSLSKPQKDVVRQAIKDQLMHPVWADAKKVLEYLANTDYHSSGTE